MVPETVSVRGGKYPVGQARVFLSEIVSAFPSRFTSRSSM
jgi:hypothetical protein